MITNACNIIQYQIEKKLDYIFVMNVGAIM